MRIAMIFSTPFPPKEGIGFYVWNLAQYMRDRGHQVCLITRGNRFSTQKEIVEGIEIYKPTFLPIYPFHADFHNIFVSRLLADIEENFDVVHVHSPLVKAPRTKLPILCTVHTPLKADIRSIQLTNRLGIMIKLQTPFSLLIENSLFRKSDRFCVVSRSVLDEMNEYDYKKPTRVIGNGVDPKQFFPSGTREKMEKPYFLSVGRLAPRKGFEDLIEAARLLKSKLPNYEFRILGEGPLFEDLLDLVEKNDLQGFVIFKGHIKERERMLKYYQDAVGYIHPAHYEGLPTVLLEAMACGKPAITTAVSGALDVINDGVNGILTPVRNPQKMSENILRIANDPEFAIQLGLEARKTVCENFSWQIIGDRYIQEYEILLKKNKCEP